VLFKVQMSYSNFGVRLPKGGQARSRGFMPARTGKFVRPDARTARKLAAAAANFAAATSAQRARNRAGQAQVIRGFVGAAGDAKYFDTATATYAANTTGSITHLSIVPQGTTVNSRIGKAFRCTSVSVRGRVVADTTTTEALAAAYLVWDYQPNKALAAVTDILDAANANAFPKRENAGRFKIIKKWQYELLGNTTTPATGQEGHAIDDFVKLGSDKNVLCTAADTTGVIGNTIEGALLFVTVGAIAAGTADANFLVGFRLNYQDLP